MEKLQTEKELQALSQKLETAVSAGRVGLWEWDIASNKVYYSPEWKKQLGYQDHEIPNEFEEWQNRLHPDDVEPTLRAIQKAHAEHCSFYQVEFRMRHKDGSYRWILAQSTITRDDAGHPIRSCGAHVDITDRKRTELALLESEANFRAFFESITDFIVVATVEGRILFGNRSLCRALGYSEAELATMHLLDLHPREMRDQAEGVLAAMIPKRSGICTLPLQAKDGTRIAVETRAWPGTWNGQDCFFGLSKDLTPEIEAQERFERLFRSNPALLALSSLPDRRFFDVNDTFLQVLGYTRDEVIGKSVEELCLFELEELQKAAGDTLLARGRIDDVELRVRCKDGRMLDGLFSGDIVSIHGQQYFLTLMVDITERKQSEELRRQSEERFRAIANHTVNLETWFGPDGSLIWINPAAERITGYSVDEIKAMPDMVSVLIAEEEREKFRHYFAKAISGESGSDFEFRCIHKNGTPYWMSASWRSIFDETGKPLGLRVSCHDITDRKRAVESLRASEEVHLALIETLPDVVVRFDHDGRHLFASHKVRELYGIEATHLLGKSFRELGCDADLCEQFEDAIHHVFQSVTTLETEYLKKGPNGLSTYNLRVIPERDSRGEVQSVLCLMRDITAHRKAERDYRVLFSEMLNGFALHEIICGEDGEPVDYRYLAVNPAFERMTGLKAEDLVGRTVLEIMPGTERYWIETYGRVAITGEPVHFEHYSSQLNKHFEVTAFRPALYQFACIFADVTERKMAAIALEKSESELRAIYENAPTMMCMLDASRQVIFANRAFVEFVGSPEEAIRNERACGVIGCVRALDSPKGCGHGPRCLNCPIRIAVEEARDTGKCSRGIEYRTEIVRNGSAREFVFLASVAPIPVSTGSNVLLCLEDITARQQALSALRDSAARFRGVVDNTQAGYFFVDSDGCFRHVNKAWLTMHGYEVPEDIIGKHYSITQVPAELPAAQRVVEQLLTGNAVPDGEYSRLCRDGSVGYHTYTARPVVQGGKVIGLEGFIIDTTDRRKADEHRAKLEMQLRQSQKMEAIGQLAGGVAHDFNNLLQVILGNVDLMQSKTEKGKYEVAHLVEVRKAAQRAADLTRQLLAFSRRQVIQPVSFDLNDLVEGVLKMIRRIIGEHIELVFQPANTIQSVFADKGQIEQVLMNLCVNARDAMPGGGRLLIETEHVEVDKLPMNDDVEPARGSYDVLIVSDTGCGMDESTRAQIFEPFFTTKGIGHGTGLGLATVYGIVRQHNGYILVNSEPGSGSTFRIYLPSVPVESTETLFEFDVEAPGGTETILLAEDEEDVRKLVRRILCGAGYNVLLARDGEEALQVYQKHGAAIDLVMLDVIMPRLGGQQTMQSIRERNPKGRFLFSSGYSADSLHKNFRLDPGTRLVTKPYSRGALLRAVRDALDAPEENGN
ncbi:MAG: PAS domain S-box protein [Candidatus Hydrogenedentes bacterium]|nr:PAS domain S-box protein [Candidatus Hydrogenedentota bacterium]